METLATIAIWGVLAGSMLGLVAHIRAPSEARGRLRRFFLKYGSMSCILMTAPLAMMAAQQALTTAAVAMGLIAFVPLVAGVVMEVLCRASGGDQTTSEALSSRGDR